MFKTVSIAFVARSITTYSLPATHILWLTLLLFKKELTRSFSQSKREA